MKQSANHHRCISFRMALPFLFLLLLTPLGFLSATAPFAYPVVPAKSQQLVQFTPAGWSVISHASGDFNSDDIEDVALVFQANIRDSIIHNEMGLGVDSVNANPRVLVILFCDPVSGYYRKIIQSNHFILRHDSPTVDDPFDGVEISEKGILQINFHFWANAGSWSQSQTHYKFRYQNRNFELIGYDSHDGHRGSGETTDHSINFSTGRMQISYGNYARDEPDSVKWTDFSLHPLMTFETFSDRKMWKAVGAL